MASNLVAHPVNYPSAMDSLLQVPGVSHVPVFHLYDDEKRQPARCELLVNAAQQWAVATQISDGGPGLVLCHLTLAIKVCQLYPIEPGNLILFTRYTDHRTYQNVYSLHFTSGGRDLFGGISFTGVNRQPVPEVDTPGLIAQLREGVVLDARWRAVQHVPAKGYQLPLPRK